MIKKPGSIIKNIRQEPIIFHRYTVFVVIAISVLSYFIIGYGIGRNNFYILMMLYIFLFTGMIYFIRYQKHTHFFNRLIALAVLFRIIFLFADPGFSDNCYRLIWDGMLISRGVNPYINIPAHLIENADILKISYSYDLFELMNSKVLYSNYPPLSVYMSFFVVLFTPPTVMGKVFLLRLVLLIFDIAIIILSIRLLEKLKQSTSLILLYALNPLIIIEVAGNLHIEVVMLFFFLLSIYFLIRGNLFASAILFSMAVCIKLVVILFLPLYFRRLKRRKRIIYYGTVFIGIFVLFLPVLRWSAIMHYLEGIKMYFTHFEFNASIYFLIEKVSSALNIHLPRHVYGFILWGITICTIFITAFTLKHKSWVKIFGGMLFVITIFYFLLPAVHPWYLLTPSVLFMFTPYRFPLAWAFFVNFSYYAYHHIPLKENIYLIAIEYIIVFGFTVYEILLYKKKYAGLKKIKLKLAI